MNAAKMLLSITILALGLLISGASQAQVAVQADSSHGQILASPDARLAANKHLVYDFWREVLEAGHMELAEKYMTESYIQHNPNVPTGRAAFVEFFTKLSNPRPIEPRMRAPLVAVVAEGNLVVLSFVSKQKDPRDPAKTYTTTWFDMFRVEGGKIAEHWDPDLKEE